MTPTFPSARKLGSLLLPAVLLILVLFTSGFIAVHYSQMNASSGQLVLPLLVTWEQDQSKSIKSITVNVSNSAGVDSLYLQIHNPGFRKSTYADQHGYDRKASVRINGGSWINIDNNNFVCQYPDRLYVIDADVSRGREGCIGGPLHTVRGRLAVDNIRDGENTIEFRFNATDGRTSGYRILDLDLLAGNQSRMTTQIVQEDPNQWHPIHTDMESLMEGRELFEQRRQLARSPRHNETIIASCADCHAADGRDLWYFNYEDEAIIARSEFHGLTREQGEKIASWIRALPELDETISVPSGYTVADLGRPWNPPYQPGPGLRDKPVELWAAGAGLEWVLDDEREAPGTERDMITHLFPNGMQGDAGFARVHPDSVLNVDEIPIAHQLPDWNNWLPEVHPFDWWQSESTVTNSDMYTGYEDIHEDFPGNIESLISEAASSPTTNSGLRRYFHRFDVQYWNDDTLPDPSLGDRDRDAIAKLSLFQWHVTKHWEIVQRYQLEDRFSDIFPGAVIRRGWPQMRMSAYFVAPHMNSRPAYPSTAPYPDQDQNVYFSTAWYELQLMLNAGAKASRGGAPFDWNYHGPHILGTGKSYNHPQGLRYLQSQIVAKQQRNTFTEEWFGRWSWEIKQVTPAKDFYGPEEKYYRHQMEVALDQGLRRDFVELLLRSFLEKTLRHDESDWPRRTADDQGHRDMPEHESYVPQPANDPDGPVSGYEFRQNNHADSYFRYLNRAQQLGVNPGLIDQAARWGNDMWPNGDWEQYYDDGSAQHSVAIVRPEDGAAYEAPVNLTLEAEAAHPSGSIARVVFYANGTKLAEINSSPYRYEWENVAAGSYELRARAYDNSGQVAHSSAVTIRVRSEGEEDDPQVPIVMNQTIHLEPGWNMVSSYVAPQDSSMEAIFSEIEDAVELVKDQQGRVYSPEFGINDIGTWQENEAYMVLARQQATLRLEGSGGAMEAGSVQLNAGWSYLPFISNTSLPTDDVFGEITRDIVFVKDLYGNIYFPEFGVDTIGELEPGRGYEAFLRRDLNISFDPRDDDSTTAQAGAPASPSEADRAAQAMGSGGPPVSPVSAILVLQAKNLPDGTVVSAWAEDERLVGTTTIDRGVGVMVIAGNEPNTEAVEGAREGETITLRARTEDSAEDDDLQIVRAADYLTGERKGAEITYSSQTIWGARVEEYPTASLEANYPNPFRTSTTIPYRLREEAHVRIEVFDVLGRRVALLVDEEQTANDYEVVLDGSMLSSGVYFYRIVAGMHEESGSMVIAK